MTPCNVMDNYQRIGVKAALFLVLDNGDNLFLREQQASTDCTTWRHSSVLKNKVISCWSV